MQYVWSGKKLDIGTRNAQFKEECPEDIRNEAKELVISFIQLQIRSNASSAGA